MRIFLMLLLMIALAAGCQGGSDEPGKPGQTADLGRDAQVATETCIECAGLGRSPHSGDERPCLLCDGEGRCGICAGQGSHRDGSCSSCDGTGRCLNCGGDGIVSAAAHDAGMEYAPVSGGCPVCLASCGLCPECGGAGEQVGGEVCRFCGGESWCPECRGAGTNRFCGGEGICPLCRGRGALKGCVPVEGHPPLTVHLLDGTRIVSRILGPPGRMISIERAPAGEVVREAIPISNILPNDVLLAYRVTAGNEGYTSRISCARYALNAGPDFLFAARHDAEAARSAGASDSEVDLLVARARELFGEWLLAEAHARLETDPRQALVLLQTHEHALPRSSASEEVAKFKVEVVDSLSAANPELSAEVIERRAAAEQGRLRRLARRADEWRVRAEDLLAIVGTSEDALLRAHRAAFESWMIFARGANRSTPELTPILLENARQARALRIRALIGLASRLLERGCLERARSLAVTARSLDPEDAGAVLFTAEVEGALGRRADEVKDR